MAIWLRSVGGREAVFPKDGAAFTLAELQAFVDGYIEIVAAPPDSHGRTCYLVINEDGKARQLPVNEIATLAFHLAGGNPFDVIVGDALIARRSEMGETDDGET